ncbi:MAG: hypothetical protein QOK17_1008 [Sphingomonadales bacterium]|nr:hypothetical protein [Sphingomonadales bacterium]
MPGKCGSPRKFSAFAKRSRHVANNLSQPSTISTISPAAAGWKGGCPQHQPRPFRGEDHRREAAIGAGEPAQPAERIGVRSSSGLLDFDDVLGRNARDPRHPRPRRQVDTASPVAKLGAAIGRRLLDGGTLEHRRRPLQLGLESRAFQRHLAKLAPCQHEPLTARIFPVHHEQACRSAVPASRCEVGGADRVAGQRTRHVERGGVEPVAASHRRG